MIKPLTVAISTILLSAAFAPAVAQEQQSEEEQARTLDKVIVTGTRAPKAVDKIPGAISVVSKEEIRHTLTLTEDATQVLARTVPGYSEASQAMSNTGENLRGRVALRLFDGVPQGSPLREGTRNATFTDMGIVERIEVINGPSASEGIGAAGGIINYISTRPSKEGTQFRVLSRYSSQFKDDSAGWKVGLNMSHKKDNFDAVVGLSRIERGMGYDANGVRLGMNTSGSLHDSVANNFFAKVGYNFGEAQEKRIQASFSDFKIAGNGTYRQVDGCRYEPGWCEDPRPNTSERGQLFETKAEFNDFKQVNVVYSDADFAGGTLVVNGYWADQAMRYPPEDGSDRQDPLIPANGPDGRIWDQSEIRSDKRGLRASWTRPNLFNVEGLELHTGIDWVKDTADQRLALTDRLWVPPMEYVSLAPYMQLSYDIGPVTLSGGMRREDGELSVDSYTTTWYRGRKFVEGGTLGYNDTMKNLGAVWKITEQFSAFIAYGEGFGLPNVGIPLRNVDTDGQTVKGIVDLQPIIVDNKEIGFNWYHDKFTLGASYYESNADFGSSLAVDWRTNDFVLNRAPTRIRGYEATLDWYVSDAVKFTAVYAHTDGMTSFWASDLEGRWGAGELKKPMGALDTNPDKLVLTARWKFSPKGDITLSSATQMSRNLSGEDVRDYDGNGDPDEARYQEFSYNESTTGYTLFDLSANYNFEKVGRFSVGIENLTNKDYILTWSQVPGFRNYWAGRGRMYSLTYEYTF